jgi:16S rRNA (guanine527-N7)-methyltransferase
VEAERIFHYFPELNDLQREQVRRLFPLYEDWNTKVNVISRKDIESLYERHVLHSLSIAKFNQFAAGSHILDLGTGGGFPGIPLAILYPDCHFHLVDSIGKKIKVVIEISKALDFKNLTAEHARAEKVKGRYDFIVSRAVARTRQLFIWTHQKIHSEQKNQIANGYILLKGGDLTDEMQEFGRPYQEIELRSYFEEEFFETKKIIYIPI